MPFSHREKIIKPETEPKIEGKDFAELEAIKRDLFERIKNEEAGSFNVTQRVMEHSIKDGLELADFLGLSTKDIIMGLFGNSISIKHRVFLGELFHTIYAHKKYLNESNLELVKKTVHYPDMSLQTYNPIMEKYWRREAEKNVSSGRLLSDIDEYYSRFLSLRSLIKEDSLGKSRQVKIEKEKKTESEKVEEAEQTGEKVLEWLKRSYEKNYETRLIKPIIWDQLISEGDFDVEILVKELARAGVSNEDITQLVYTPLIDLKNLKNITDKIGLDLESPDMAKKLEKFRWKPYQVAVRGEISHSKKILLNSLVDEIEAQTGGQKTLVLGEDGEYKIVENTGDREKREGKNEEIDFKNPKKEISDLYEEIFSVREISGKIAFEAQKNGLYYIIHGDKELGPYVMVENLKEISGKLTIKVKRNGKDFILHGDEEFGPYENIEFPQEINSKLTFKFKEGEKFFIRHGNQILGPYKEVSNVEEILGKLTFLIRRNNNSFIIHGDKEFGPYEVSSGAEEINGKLTFYAGKIGEHLSLIHGDEEFGPYDFSSHAEEINGKLTFEFSEGRKKFIRHGNEILGPYDYVGKIEEISGKLTFMFEEKGKRFIQYGSETIGPYDNNVYDIKEINGKLVFVFAGKGSEESIQYGSETIGPYKSISYLKEINNELIFSFEKNNKKYIRYGSAIIGPFLESEKITNIQEINNKLVFVKETDKIDQLYEINSLYYDGKEVFSFVGDLKLIKERKGELLIVIDSDGDVTSYTFDINNGSEKQEQNFEFTEEEQKRLDLLNILESIGDKTDMDIIYEYFAKYYPEQKFSLKESIKQALSGSFMVKKAITEAIKDSPKAFMSTMSAKADNTNDTYIEHLVFSLFPEIRENMRNQERQNNFSGSFFGGLGRNEKNSISPEDNFRELLFGGLSGRIEGGDPMDESQVEVLKLRESVEGMVATSIYGSYSDNRWNKVEFPVSEENSGVTKETTFEIPNTYGMKEIVLPKLINSKILMDRIKGIDASGKEVSLVGEKNKLGEVRVKIPEGVDKILYSQTEDIVPKVPMDISEDEYNRYVRKIDKIYGEKLYESIATLPDEVRLFLVSIEDKSPKEKIIEVENFVRKYGYYDFKNREVQEEKRGKSISEVLSVMEFRMQEIKRSKPELREELQDKKYAGVCADFSLLATAMLRELGIPSGLITGFRADPDSLSVNTTQAHAVSYAMWPSVDGKTDIITIDGTPRGVTAEEEKILSRIRQHSLIQKEKEIKENSKQILEAAKAKFADFERILEENDMEKIKSLTNGELESVLNTLLGYVKEPHLKIIESVLNAGRYAGFDIKKLSDNSEIDNKVAFYNFIEAEIKRERKFDKEVVKDNTFSRGSELMDLVSDFADRYVKDGSSRKESLELLQKVIDISERSLDPIEKRVATAVVKYLEAVRMKGK